MDGYANCFYRNDDGRFVEVAPELGLDTGGGDSGGTRFARLLLLFLASSFNDLYLNLPVSLSVVLSCLEWPHNGGRIHCSAIM